MKETRMNIQKSHSTTTASPTTIRQVIKIINLLLNHNNLTLAATRIPT